MALNTTTPRVEYTASSSQVQFTFSFKVFDDTDLLVYQTPTGQTANDETDILTLTTDYTVTIDGDDGGYITLTSGATSGDKITLTRSLVVVRETDYQQGGDILADVIDNDQNYQTYMIQDLNISKTRYIQLPNSLQGTSNVLPSPNADYYIKWNSSGNALENDETIPTNVQLAIDKAAEASGYADDADTAKQAAQAAQAAAEAVYDTFDDRYLGAKASAPTLDNDGNALQDGAIYYNTTANVLYIYDLGTTTWLGLPVTNLNTLQDVDVSSLAINDILRWDGTNWINEKRIIDTIADLRLQTETPNTVWVSGYHTANDGAFGSHFFRWNSTSTEDDNGGTIIKLDGVETGRYELQFDGAVNVKWFGVTGVGYPTDEGTLLNNVATYCRTNNLMLYLGNDDMRIYTTTTIDFTGITVIGEKAATMNFGYSAGSASYGYDILSNVLGNRPSAATFYGLEDRYNHGQMIYSDIANPVVKISNNAKYKNFGVSGWIGTSGQVGIQHEYNATYSGVHFFFDNVSVSGCGGDGISLENGIEVSVLERVSSGQNYGYGLTTYGGGGDDNQEYTEFRDCSFSMNKLDGVRLSHFKKQVKFYNCNGNSNGWYGLGASALVKPADQTYIRGMVVVDGTTSAIGRILIVDNCFAEDCARMVSVLADYPIKNVVITNNLMYPTLNLSDTNNHMVYLESISGGTVGQIYSLTLKGNELQDASRGKTLHGEMAATNIIGVEFDTEVSLSTFYAFDDFKQYIKTELEVQKEVILSKHLAVGRVDFGDGTLNTFTTTYVTDNMVTSGRGNSTSSRGACFLVTSNWQATNANYGGAYLVYATVMPSGQIVGSSLAFGSTAGFTSAPTLDTDGTLNIPLAQYYRGSVTRIDMNGERA